MNKRRLLIVLGTSWLLTVIEMVNHFEPDSSSLFEPEFWYSAPIYALVLPLITWNLLQRTERREKREVKTTGQLDRLAYLRNGLMSATSWDNLVKTIIRYPGHVLPTARATLFTFNEAASALELAARWISIRESKRCFPSASSVEECSGCLAALSPAEYAIRLCPVSGTAVGNKTCARYCAPLSSKGRLTALLQIELTPDLKLSDLEMETLTRALPEMSWAISHFGLQRHLAEQVWANSQAILLERQRLAQDLHDSLAQSISYLRLKLDQLSQDGKLQEIADIRHDIECMRDAATDAYEHVRSTLAAVNPVHDSVLTEALREQAIQAGDRAGFTVALQSRPDRFALTPEVHRQVLFICQEALNNVEKHADAQTVTIQVDWGERYLTLSIADDGSGFDLAGVSSSGHLGLAIMKQRAQSIGGELTIDSRAGFGTLVTLCFPVPHP